MTRHSVTGALLLGVGVVAGWLVRGATVPVHAAATTALNAGQLQSSERTATMRGRVVGVGGIFFKAGNQQQMKDWYATNLGLVDGGHGAMLPWREKDNPDSEHVTVWSIFPGDTKYFEPSRSSFMLNYIVDDLDALLERLTKAGVRIDPKRQDESYGRFAWIYDPDGNKIELWQPVNGKK